MEADADQAYGKGGRVTFGAFWGGAVRVHSRE